MAEKGRYYEMIMAGNLYDDETTVRTKHSMWEFHSTQALNIENSHSRQQLIANKETKSAKKMEDAIQYWKILIRLLELAKPEWPIICLASVLAVLIGISAIIFSTIIGELHGVRT